VPRKGHWVGVRAVGTAGGRDMLGARVAVAIGGRTYWRRVRSDGSYASANDPRVLVGIGTSIGAARVEIIWPDGMREQFDGVPTDRWVTETQGTGMPLEPLQAIE
jgi:hypothetical protein